jgi:hypothetical protein
MLEENNIDFSMDISIIKNQVASLGIVVVSKTLLTFHGVVLISIIIVTLISIYI